MRSSLVATAIVVAGLATWSCGGSGGSSANPAAPPPTGSVASTINIVGDRGSQSFSPNPATVVQGDMLMWRNNDTVVHHIVMNDGSLDSGDIAPGATSAALRLGTNGANYHCTIHPLMVGSIRRSSGDAPPCDGPYC